MHLHVLLISLLLLFHTSFAVDKDVTKLQVGVKHRPEKCDKKAAAGDVVYVHYTGYLVDGTVFDSSAERVPLSFTLGAGQVIAGWEAGVVGACIGEKRKLKIPPDMGYGEAGFPPKIPGQATLIFEIELMHIKSKDETS